MNALVIDNNGFFWSARRDSLRSRRIGLHTCSSISHGAGYLAAECGTIHEVIVQHELLDIQGIDEMGEIHAAYPKIVIVTLSTEELLPERRVELERVLAIKGCLVRRLSPNKFCSKMLLLASQAPPDSD